MSLLEGITHSFIVKLWIEEISDDDRQVLWRGTITHVPSGARRHLRTLEEIIDFILPYLEVPGVRPNWWTQMRRWRHKWRLFSRRHKLQGLSNDSPEQGGQE